MPNFEENAEITWEADVNAVRVIWKNLFMNLDRFKEICDVAFKVLLENKGDVWIADQYLSEGVFNNEIQRFILNELSQAGQENGVQMVLTVLPKNSGLSTISVKRWSSGIKDQKDFINEQFETLEECKKWIHLVKTKA